jgi:hypothetical protein
VVQHSYPMIDVSLWKPSDGVADKNSQKGVPCMPTDKTTAAGCHTPSPCQKPI